jgi:hypothetical protein
MLAMGLDQVMQYKFHRSTGAYSLPKELQDISGRG